MSSILWLKYNFLFFVEHFLGRDIFESLFKKFENRLISQIDLDLQKRKYKNDFKVVELKKGEYENFRIKSCNPIVFRGAAENWSCCENWSFEFFIENFGKKQVAIHDHKPAMDPDHPQEYKELRFDDYIQQLKAGSKDYLKFSKVIERESSLQNDFNLNWLGKLKALFSFGGYFFFFMGGKDTKTPIHSGFAETVFIQVEGIKKWTFYPPEDRVFLGVRPERKGYFYSPANPDKPNELQYPLLKHLNGRSVLLYPGDVLYFPSFVWHKVENMTDTIGAAYKFVDIARSFRSSKMLTLLYFMATKPTVFRSYWEGRIKKGFDYDFRKGEN